VSVRSAVVERAADAVGRIDAIVGGSHRRRIIAVLAAALALDSADKAAIGAAARQLETSMHIDAFAIGLLLSASGLVAAAATLPAGWAVDRVNRTRLLSAAVLTWGVAMLLSGVATGFAFLFVTQLALGALTAVAGPAVASLVGDYFPRRDRARIYGYIIAGELVGTGVGFIAAGELAPFSWRFAFLVLVLPAVTVARLVHRLPEPPRGGRVDSDKASTSLRAAFGYILRTRTNVVLIVASALGYFFFAGVRGFGMQFTTRQYGVPQRITTLLLLLLGVGAIAGVLVVGRYADRRLRRGHAAARIELAAALPAIAALCFVPALVTRSMFVALPLFIAAVACLGGTNPPLDAARLDIMPPQLWGRAEAVRTVLRSGFEALAPLTFGFLASHVFSGRAGLQATFLIMLAPLLLASLLVLTVGCRTYPADVATAQAAAVRG
jgi:predicted MFS family arabinose efflux permease